MTVDVSTWTSIGKSDNADFYRVDSQVLAVVPFEGSTDGEATAKESIRIQLDYMRAEGIRAGVVVFMDPVAEQTAEARTVYRLAPDPAFHVCFALVGGTVFGRAVGSIFMGLHPPRVPTRMFRTYEEAVAWVRERLMPR